MPHYLNQVWILFILLATLEAKCLQITVVLSTYKISRFKLCTSFCRFLPYNYSRESLELVIPVENIGPKPSEMCTQFKTLKIKGLRGGNTNKY